MPILKPAAFLHLLVGDQIPENKITNINKMLKAYLQ